MTQTSSCIGSICVYLGSRPGTKPAYKAAARDLGEAIACNGIRLVYGGGGGNGLMGSLSSTIVRNGGNVLGFIPEFLQTREQPVHDGMEIHIVKDMHERKTWMFIESDAFVALPGGIGTLEELVEMMTWRQLGRHQKPIVLLNVAGFWDPFLALLHHQRNEGFMDSDVIDQLLVAPDVASVLPLIRNALAAQTTTVSDASVVRKF